MLSGPRKDEIYAREAKGAEKTGVTDLSDQVFCSGQWQTILAGLGVDSAHVNAEADIAIFLRDEQGVGGPGTSARLGNVGSVILRDAFVEELLLVVGKATLALPMGLGITGRDAEIAMDSWVDCADIELM